MISLSSVETIALTHTAAPDACLFVSLQAAGPDCVALGTDVTADLDGRSLTMVAEGTFVPFIEQTGAECATPKMRLSGPCPSPSEAVSTLTVSDATRTLTVEIDNLWADRTLERRGEDPASLGSEIEFPWSPSTDEMGDILANFTVDNRSVTADVRREAAAFFVTVPSSLPLGRNRVAVSMEYTLSLRCPGLTCRFAQFTTASASVEVVAE